MLYAFLKFCLWLYIAGSLLLSASTGYAYRVNSRLEAGDPQKKVYHPLAIVLLPFWPVLALASLSLFVLRAAAYGIFLLVFTFALVVIRKPFLLSWLEKTARNVGNKLLKANMLIVRLFLPQPANEST